MSRHLILILASVLFVFCFCTTDSSNKMNDSTTVTSSPINKPDTITSVYDDVLSYFQLQIREHYNKSLPEDKPITLELGGSISYNDDDFLIISFVEIMKYGSWHTSYSSVIFKKLDDNNLIRIFTNSPDTVTGPNIDNELAYPGRINGLPYIITDLNGDGIKDLLFKSETYVRDSEYTTYSFFTYDNEVLTRSKLTFSAESYQCLDGFCGTENIVNLHYFDFPPKIYVKTREISMDKKQDGSFIVNEVRNLYRWDDKEKDFVSDLE